MLPLSELNPAIAPPLSRATEDVKFELTTVTLSPAITIAPPLVRDSHEVNETFWINML